MKYLNSQDYGKAIRPDILQIITGGDPTLRADAEQAAIMEMSAYLNSRFDLSLIFMQYPAHDQSIHYTIGRRVVYSQAVYEAIQDIPPSVFDSTKWILKFERNPLVTMLLVDIALYHLHSRIAPKDVPEIRLNRYEDAIKYLRRASLGEINPLLPLAPSGNPDRAESPIKWGGKAKFSVIGSSYF